MKLKFIALAVAALLISSCASKTSKDKSEGTAAATSDAANPMNFDAAGSDSGKIDGLKTIRFEYNSDAITEEAKSILAGNVEWLKKNASVKIQIEGHCDHRGSIEYNLALGERRAKTVMAYLVTLGIAQERLSTLSYGKEKPLINSDSDMADAQNRRANFMPLKN